jgi:hypothetical protein
MNINRLDISGPIDINTPQCVLKEICFASSIKFDSFEETLEYRNKIIFKIYSYKGENISDKYEQNNNDLRIIARFVNGNHNEWRKEVLLQSYHFLLTFKETKQSFGNSSDIGHNIKQSLEKDDIGHTFVNSYFPQSSLIEESKNLQKHNIGEQTSLSPYSLNACVLYKMCKFYNLNVKWESTIKEMATLVKYKLSIDENHLLCNEMKSILYNQIKFHYTSADLINLYSFITNYQKHNQEKHNQETHNFPILNEIDTNTKEEIFTGASHDKYFEIANAILSGVSSNDSIIKPKNGVEAVIMAALYYKIDLSKCEKPMIEYDLLCLNPYFPSDEKLKKRLYASYLDADSLENPYLNVNFNPNFPINMYSEENLQILCENECIDPNEQNEQNEQNHHIENSTAENYYTSLQMAYLTETFIHGKQGNFSNTCTTFLDDIDKLHYDEVVTYGVRHNFVSNSPFFNTQDKGHETSNMRAFTYTELYDVFSSYKKFSNPSTREIFSQEVIRKLYILTQKPRRRNESKENYLNRLQLGDEIERIQIYNNSNNKSLKEFLHRYEQCDDEDKNKVEEILMNLLHCGMYMRNWDGKGDFPLKSEQTNYDIENQIIIDDRVTQSLIKFDNSVAKLKNFGNFILNMPLMEYNFESKVFTIVTEECEGLSIKDRIKIVKKGENELSTSSCIRLSSNKFCASAFFYMILIGFKLPFAISEVSHIF